MSDRARWETGQVVRKYEPAGEKSNFVAQRNFEEDGSRGLGSPATSPSTAFGKSLDFKSIYYRP